MGIEREGMLALPVRAPRIALGARHARAAAGAVWVGLIGVLLADPAAVTAACTMEGQRAHPSPIETSGQLFQNTITCARVAATSRAPDLARLGPSLELPDRFSRQDHRPEYRSCTKGTSYSRIFGPKLKCGVFALRCPMMCRSLRPF